MIVVRIYAGLGNQLFQYSFAKFMSKLYETDLWLDPSWDENTKSSRTFELDHFNTAYTGICEQDRLSDLRRALRPIDEWEFDNSYDGWLAVVRSGDNIILDGYWASHTEYLFKPTLTRLVRNELTLRAGESNERYKRYRADIETAAVDRVSVHVLRGGYLRNSQIFEILEEGYYRRAMSQVRSRVPRTDDFVFSEHLEWVKHNFDSLEDAIFVETRSNVLDLDLMKRCSHHTIANSTCSWWGAFLNDREDNTVVAPAIWFSNKLFQQLYKSTNFVSPSWLQV